MSACSRTKEKYTTVIPQYVNQKYLQEVGVISMSDSRYSHEYDHVTHNESQLIENAKLTSSEREVNKLRLSGNFEFSDSVFSTGLEQSNEFERQEQVENVDEDTSEQRDEEYVSAVDFDKDDAAMFYETQTDESTLIRYAKLADDGLDEAAKCSGKLIHDILSANERELKFPLDTTDEHADGFQTPVNSEDGYKTTEEIKKKLATCYQVSRNFDVPESNTAENMKRVAPYDQNTVTTEVHLFDSKIAENSKQAALRNNIQAVEITGADDEAGDDDFCKLVHEVVNHLQDCDLDEILSMFAGSGILEMTGLVPPAALMEILMRHRLISRDNLYHLEGLIIRLDDTDLYTKAVQYMRHHHDIVYFYQDKDIPTKGFGKVRCFVGGRDFTRLTREDLELVRFKVASLVFMPAHYVYIVGIEPGQKVVVTLMLLERYVQELSEMAREGLAELGLVKVDAIQIYGKTYSTAGTTAIEKYREGGHASFLSVYQQLRDKSKHLEERDVEVRKLREEAELKQLELETMGAELEILTEKALRESVVRKRLRDQPINRHPRTRSFPLSFRELPDDKMFAQALDTAVVTKAVGRVHDKDRRNTPEIAHNADGMIQSGHARRPNQDNITTTVVLRSPRRKYEMFEETNELMGEIEAILGELALTDVK